MEEEENLLRKNLTFNEEKQDCIAGYLGMLPRYEITGSSASVSGIAWSKGSASETGSMRSAVSLQSMSPKE